ncbi:DnaJ domain-containing protein, partial [Anaerosporobacter sp.]
MWEILGIKATHDIKEIKRAYAKMLTIYHPEDNPEKFMVIQEAYEYAINYAKNANKYSSEANINIPFEKDIKNQEKKTDGLQTGKEQRKIIFEKANIMQAEYVYL